ncbi:MAG: PPC domain-containing protein [Phycisphaerales bacterium]
MARSSRSSSRSRPNTLVVAALVAGCAAPCAVALPGSPELRSVLPTGGQRGTTVKLALVGERLAGAQELLFYGAGIGAANVANVDEKTVTAEVTIAGDCGLGEHPLRLRTASGITELTTFWVGALPVVAEVEPNGDVASAQRIALNTTIDGVVTREDADYFAFDAKAGERITAEIEGMRLGRAMFDPAIAILDSKRFELAVCDDSFLLRQDSTATIVAPSDGTYYVLVRDASYGGGDTSRYRLHVGTFPRPQGAWPLAAKPGEAASIEWIGDAKAPPPTTVTLDPNASGIVPVFAREGDAIAPSPNWVVASNVPVLPEQKPDAMPAAGSEPQSPIAFHGVIAAPGEEDRFRVRVKGGEPLLVRVVAQRLRSPLDAVLTAFDAKGTQVGVLDDSVGADPELKVTPPEDATFELRIRDHRHRGGASFAYRLELVRPEPSIALGLERVDNRRPQFLQSIAVPRGGHFAAMLRVDRDDVGGEATIEAAGLPNGVSMRAAPIPPDLPNAPVIFDASPDAPLNGGLYELRAHVGNVLGRFRQVMPLVIAAPNDTVYYQTTVDRLAVAVTDAAPFRVRIAQPSAPILRQGAKQLSVVVERDAGFTGDVAVQMLWNPPGISSASAITIPAAQSEAAYQLNASGDAPLKTWKIAVLAHAPVQGGDVWVSSDLVDLAVADGFETGAIQLAATERGKPAALLCKLQSVRPFEGKAKLTLLGLPPKTACPPKEIASGDQEIVFEVATEADAPVGQHRGLFCELACVQAGETVTHRFAFDGVLRIDAPAPAPTTEAATPAPPPPPTAPAPPEPPRPLSRLEQLRKDAAGAKPAGEEKPK